MDKEDVSVLIMAVRNAIYKKKYLLAIALLVDLKAVLKPLGFERKVDGLISEVGALSKSNGANVEVVEKELKLLDVEVPV